VKRIRTEHWYPYAPLETWSVLADFDSYADWNPLNIQAHGEARLGARIPMTFINPARPGSTVAQTVTITACEAGRQLAWRGHVPLLFRGDHFFNLAPEREGTRLLHGEDSSGLIPATFSAALIARNFVPAYEAANRALGERLAQLYAGRRTAT
jgi:hypothetical protein